MKNLFFSLLLLSIVSCKKGFVLNSSKIILTNEIVNTDETLEYELQTDAFYKGKKIEPTKIVWSIKDAARVNYYPASTNGRKMTFKPQSPADYTITATFTFDTKDNNSGTKNLETTVVPSYDYLKNKVIGNYSNGDMVNPSFKMDLFINSDFTFSAQPELSNQFQNIFLKANNIFSGCKINITGINQSAKLQGTIILHDSLTNELRTDYLRDVTFSQNFTVISFKQLYANDTNKFRYFSLNRRQ